MTCEIAGDVYLGLDVGKGEDHATATNRTVKRMFDKPLPNSEPRLQELLGRHRTEHGTVPVVVGQPAFIGALPLGVVVNCHALIGSDGRVGAVW
ncbi:transposase [Streptomyces sp900105245]|uniref:Transposase n=1 Tax=Streptomyces sp. 900105245 TaxID=3154379 RepID=A0ABV1ULH6_9ACTN